MPRRLPFQCDPIVRYLIALSVLENRHTPPELIRQWVHQRLWAIKAKHDRPYITMTTLRRWADILFE